MTLWASMNIACFFTCYKAILKAYPSIKYQILHRKKNTEVPLKPAVSVHSSDQVVLTKQLLLIELGVVPPIQIFSL